MKRKNTRISKHAAIVVLVFAVVFVLSAGVFAESGSSPDHLNINTADVEQLTDLPGIGYSKAEAIVKYRSENGPFPDVVSLTNVRGIGMKLLEKIRPFITTVNQ